jgi:hypothetical protein
VLTGESLREMLCRSPTCYILYLEGSDNPSSLTLGEKEERAMTTGMHQVSDIFCLGCGTTVGWKYWRASENSQKYKENKMILERALIVRSDEGKNGGQAMETVARINWTSTRLILPLPSLPIPVISFPTPNEVPSDSGDEDF